jgi:hypothetical protein
MRPRKKLYLFCPDEALLRELRFVLEVRANVHVEASTDRAEAVRALRWAQSRLVPAFDVVLAVRSIGTEAVLAAAGSLSTVELVADPGAAAFTTALRAVCEKDRALLLHAVRLGVQRRRGPRWCVRGCGGAIHRGQCVPAALPAERKKAA